MVAMISGANKQSPKEVRGLTEEQRRDINMFLQGLVYGWCASRGTELFAAHDLVGGVNWKWSGTPLQCVYAKQKTIGKTAYNVAAQEVGRLLKKVIIDDKRTFTCKKQGRDTYHYSWDGKYPPKV